MARSALTRGFHAKFARVVPMSRLYGAAPKLKTGIGAGRIRWINRPKRRGQK